MSKTKIKVHLNDKKTIQLELDKKEVLKNIRKELMNYVTFPFIFVDDEDNEISQDEERVKILKDILDGKNLTLKKKIIENRKILGNKIGSKGKMDYYIYPQFKFTADQEDFSTNILVVGETGVGKSTWIHALLNYIQGIQIEENVRYKIFDQTELRKRYEKKYGKKYGEKQSGSSDTDEPAIYNIIPNDEYSPYENPIRIIDTAGFGDTRGKEYDEKIRDDIRKMFETSNMESLNAVCLIFKGTETRSHERTKDILDKLFSLFGKEIRNNIIVIFTFSNSSTDAMTVITTLKDISSTFYQIMDDIDKIPHFFFNLLILVMKKELL
jgi:GTPase SAR1 family protein